MAGLSMSGGTPVIVKVVQVSFLYMLLVGGGLDPGTFLLEPISLTQMCLVNGGVKFCLLLANKYSVPVHSKKVCAVKPAQVLPNWQWICYTNYSSLSVSFGDGLIPSSWK
jgi:hypothetical protein